MVESALEKNEMAYTSFVDRTLLVAFHWLGMKCHVALLDMTAML